MRIGGGAGSALAAAEVIAFQGEVAEAPGYMCRLAVAGFFCGQLCRVLLLTGRCFLYECLQGLPPAAKYALVWFTAKARVGRMKVAQSGLPVVCFPQVFQVGKQVCGGNPVLPGQLQPRLLQCIVPGAEAAGKDRGVICAGLLVLLIGYGALAGFAGCGRKVCKQLFAGFLGNVAVEVVIHSVDRVLLKKGASYNAGWCAMVFCAYVA